MSNMIDRGRKECGRVQSYSVNRGQLFTESVSQICTEIGTYRVYGDVGSIENGELVSIRGNMLVLGVLAENRKYKLVN